MAPAGRPQGRASTGVSSVPLRLTNLDKIYWREENLTKGDLIDFYSAVSPYILNHLKDRPLSLNRHPDGAQGKHFFQKDLSGFHPSFFVTHNLPSHGKAKTIRYGLCQNEKSLAYLVNMGCIELNPWLSRIERLERPDFSVIDIDPDKQDFEAVLAIALAFHDLLEEMRIKSYCKSSGASGIHIYVPLLDSCGCGYDISRSFAAALCSIVHSQKPTETTLERSPGRRRGKVYLDYLQNKRGQTLAAPYCVRPRPKAPVSTPVTWDEVKNGFCPTDFTLTNMPDRLRGRGDLWHDIFDNGADIGSVLPRLPKIRGV